MPHRDEELMQYMQWLEVLSFPSFGGRLSAFHEAVNIV